MLRSSVVAQFVEPGPDAKTGPVYGTDSDRLVGAGRGTLFMLREHLRTSIMGGRCDRPDAAACDYRLTYRSSQMVRTGAAKTKQCCEHMISATTTRELSTGLDESAGKTHIAWTSDCNRRCRKFRPVHARHEHTTRRVPSEMVAWWTPGRRLLAWPPSGLSCGWKGTRTRRSESSARR